MTGWARLGLFALGGLMIAYGLSEPDVASVLDPKLKDITAQRPDAFMEGVYQRRYDATGALETTLVATSILDFGERAHAELVDPKVWLERSPATWYIEGDFGQLSGDRNQLLLTDNVTANRLEAGTATWTLSGQTLTWDQTTDLVTSERPTTLVQDTAVSQGDSLVMDLNTNEYTLGEQVITQWHSTSSD
jgi:LPS export ABC transporter protein LptC